MNNCIKDNEVVIDFKEAYTNYNDWYSIFSILHIIKRIETINGIKIYIYADEDRGKHKLPHIHAKYNDKEVVARIDNGDFIEGTIDKNKQKILKNWIMNHQDLIKEKWNELNSGIIIPIF